MGKAVLFMAAGAALAWLVFGSDISVDFNSGSDEITLSGNGPAEFLYLDNARAKAYLAQIEGGTFEKQKLTQKVTRTAGAELGAEKIAKISGSQSQENFVEREVTPTAASIYFTLQSDLDNATNGLRIIGLGHFNRDFLGAGDPDSALREGQFVRFETAGLRAPDYLNPYLVVRQTGTLAAIFPNLKKNSEALRDASRAFAKQVGDNPRLVFALAPRNGAPVRYLMPMSYLQLTDERSLIKNGGGTFTVVGKVVRIFNQPRGGDPSYVDSPTRETWAQALRRAPLDLLTRSTRTTPCGQKPDMERAQCLVRRLKRQTKIDGKGAVIIPVAIYK